jgi:hypothetical protein
MFSLFPEEYPNEQIIEEVVKPTEPLVLKKKRIPAALKPGTKLSKNAYPIRVASYSGKKFVRGMIDIENRVYQRKGNEDLDRQHNAMIFDFRDEWKKVSPAVNVIEHLDLMSDDPDDFVCYRISQRTAFQKGRKTQRGSKDIWVVPLNLFTKIDRNGKTID